MNREFIFIPEKRPGLIIDLIIAAITAMIAAAGIYSASKASIGPVFMLLLLPPFLAVIVLPLVGYRAYALQSAFYRLERDGIRLRWGLRVEDIPMSSVLWVRAIQDIPGQLPLPWLRWPGAVVGRRKMSDGWEIEFMADSTENLVLIATQERIYAISPNNPKIFMRTFFRYTELGSFTPLEAHSTMPTFILSRVWASAPARILLAVAFFISLFLFIWVSLLIPGRAEISFSFDPYGAPLYSVPAVRLLLLPILNGIFLLFNFFTGLFFFRKEENPKNPLPSGQLLAYLMWGCGACIPVLFFFAISAILKAS